jgi:tetratricopeptide (TPR) repeat protein
MSVVRAREALLDSLAGLRDQESTPQVRLAIAEAEFRLAVDPDTDRDEAIARLRAAITQDPFLPKLNLHLGRLLHQAGKHRAALVEYRQVLRMAPSNRRAHVLFALALLELDKDERTIGQSVLTALNSDAPDSLPAAVAAFDELVRRQGTEAKPDARPAREAKTRAANRSAPDVWQTSLVEQLSRAKPQRGQVRAHLDVGAARARDGSAVAEFAVACVLLLVAGDSPRDVRKTGPSGIDHPAVALLEAALELAEAETPETFVELAVARLDSGVLPVELVCWLHFSRYGPDSGLPPADVVRLLDAYPDVECVRELRLSVLDGLARAAWTDERLAEARLLWRESAALDPHRVPLAVNLALLAARTKSVDDYGPAWSRLTELMYLHAAGTGELTLLLDERRTLHLALSQQSRSRHCAPSNSPYPSDAELAAWVADVEAIEVWLREWDLYYLNERLNFRSPAHLLGVPQNATAEEVDAARDAFVRSVDSTLRGQDWAGVTVFRDLVVDRVREAHAVASDPAEQARDAYRDLEKPRAARLADEALRRGLLLRNMIRELSAKKSAHQLALGVEMARRQLTLPWTVLTPICVERGLISEDDDLVGIFQVDLVNLAVHWEEPTATTPEEWDERVTALGECVALVPDRLEFAVLHSRALVAAERPDEGYAAAVAALDRQAAADDEEARSLRPVLVGVVDSIAEAAIPAHLRSPRDPASARRTLAAGRSALERYPRSGSLRRAMADILLQLGSEAFVREAIELLSDAIDLALDDDDRIKSETKLAATHGAAAEAAVRAQIEKLTEPANARVNEAVEELRRDSGPEAIAAARLALREAMTAVGEAMAMAERAGFTDDVTRLAEQLEQLRIAESNLSHDGE